MKLNFFWVAIYVVYIAATQTARESCFKCYFIKHLSMVNCFLCSGHPFRVVTLLDKFSCHFHKTSLKIKKQNKHSFNSNSLKQW